MVSLSSSTVRKSRHCSNSPREWLHKFLISSELFHQGSWHSIGIYCFNRVVPNLKIFVLVFSLQTTKYRTPKSVSSIGSYQSGSKRQNVGQRIQVLPAERLVAQNMPVQRFNMAPQAHPNGAINSNFPYLPARAVFMPQMANAPFYGMPRIADLPNVSHSSQQQNGPNGQYIPQPRSQVLQIYGPRLPLPPPATHQEHHHQLQQQNFYFSGPMGPPPAKTPDDPSKAEKKARFLRTAQILEQSGLMECTLKTAALMRENASLQREIDALTTESNHIINHFLSSQLNDNGIKPHQQLAFENQNQQMHAQVHSQHQNHGQSPMSLPIMLYPGGMAWKISLYCCWLIVYSFFVEPFYRNQI